MKNIFLSIIIIVLLFGAGWYMADLTRDYNDQTTFDTVYVSINPDTIYAPAEIKYQYIRDSIYVSVPAKIDTVAYIDTVFVDSARLRVEYYYHDQYFSLLYHPAKKRYITETKTITQYVTAPYKWYDGIGVGIGYDPFRRSVSMSVGYTFNIGNLKAVMR